MQKQIIFSKFIPRLFATTIDLVILSIILTPIMNLVSRYIFIYFFHQFFVDSGIDISNNQLLAEAVKKPEFISSVSGRQFFPYLISVFTLNILLMGSYFVFFWHKFSATPGKIIMHMKIVDASNYSKPSLYRFCKRFCGYITIFIGIFMMLASKKCEALHDKIANTVVIKT